jgi:hypothetical protein
MSRARRIKPSTLEGRKRQAELGKIISNPRTNKADRAAALEELDRIAPVEGSGSLREKSILSVEPPAKPVESLSVNDGSTKPTRADLDAWRDRILDRREGIPRPAVPTKELDLAAFFNLAPPLTANAQSNARRKQLLPRRQRRFFPNCLAIA